VVRFLRELTRPRWATGRHSPLATDGPSFYRGPVAAQYPLARAWKRHFVSFLNSLLRAKDSTRRCLSSQWDVFLFCFSCVIPATRPRPTLSGPGGVYRLLVCAMCLTALLCVMGGASASSVGGRCSGEVLLVLVLWRGGQRRRFNTVPLVPGVVTGAEFFKLTFCPLNPSGLPPRCYTGIGGTSFER